MPHDKLIPINDLVQLITDAGVSHQRGIYATSLSKLTVRGGDPLADLSTAYELAASLGIPEERMDEVIANRYPSVETQLDALEHQGAVATTKAVAQTYQLEIENTLRSALPGSAFRATVEHLTRKFDQPQHPDWHRTSRLYFQVTVSSGVFIKLCSETLDRLRARFERHNGIAGYVVEYDYVVE
jgi:hypothetical protein